MAKQSKYIDMYNTILKIYSGLEEKEIVLTDVLGTALDHLWYNKMSEEDKLYVEEKIGKKNA